MSLPRTSTILLTATVLAASMVLPVAADSGRWVPAARDATTGAVVPLDALATAQPPPSAPQAIRTGTIVVNITISIRSALPATVKPMCFATINHGTNSGGAWQSYYQTDGVLAARSGNTATCSVRLPFSWADVTPANRIIVEAEVTTDVERLATNARPVSRNGVVNLPALDFPAAGGTRTVALSTAL
mgnify:CR=1 FL=1